MNRYVKYDPARNYRRKFGSKLSGDTVPSTRGIHELLRKVRSTRSLLVKKPATKRRALIEKKLD
jgi:hypothetical protein